MIKLSLSPSEAFALLFAAESLQEEAPESLQEALSSASGKLCQASPCSPFRSAREALKRGFLGF
jgi:predicted DNA-binding transcriptional regulator YafY